MEKYYNDNNIKTKIKNEENILNEIYQYFTVIIDALEKHDNLNLRLEHIRIIKNLLFSEKDNKIHSNLDDLENSNNYKLNSFILSNTLKAFESLFKTKFNIDDSNDLNKIYLNLIF